jgi:hypothetical protein
MLNWFRFWLKFRKKIVLITFVRSVIQRWQWILLSYKLYKEHKRLINASNQIPVIMDLMYVLDNVSFTNQRPYLKVTWIKYYWKIHFHFHCRACSFLQSHCIYYNVLMQYLCVWVLLNKILKSWILE